MELTRKKIEEIIASAVMSCADEAPPTVTPQTTLEQLGYDSLSLVELLLAIEEDTGREIDDEVWEGVWGGATTIAEIVDGVAVALGVAREEA